MPAPTQDLNKTTLLPSMKPMIDYYRDEVVKTESTLKREAIMSLFRLYQWDLPEQLKEHRN